MEQPGSCRGAWRKCRFNIPLECVFLTTQAGLRLHRWWPMADQSSFSRGTEPHAMTAGLVTFRSDSQLQQGTSPTAVTR
eukprot:1034598-Rhodomonas_salina.1